MKKVLLIITVAILAAGCSFYHGKDGENGRDGSLNMRVAYYEIESRHWIFDPGEGPDGLNRHFFYNIDNRMDRDLEYYLNRQSFDNIVLMIEREMEVYDEALHKWVVIRQPLSNTAVIEGLYQSSIEQHTEVLAYDYSGDPAQITIYFVDSRFDLADAYYPPVDMKFRAVFMWP